VLVGVAIVAIAGRSSSGSRSASSGTSTAPSAATATPADVNGRWSGALVGVAPVTMNLKQNGTDVTGDLSEHLERAAVRPAAGTRDRSRRDLAS
jgi:hypothetical protein